MVAKSSHECWYPSNQQRGGRDKLCSFYFGQPIHAFDLDKFEDSRIVARDARDGEKLVTLDGEERELTAEDIVITVADKPIALAGVMGGASTEIDTIPKTLFLESAVLMANLFVRQAAVLTFVQNRHHALKRCQ